MGYKRAGFEVVGANDIDQRMMDHYVENLSPRNSFVCPVSDLTGIDLPDELFGVDVLDGSPPCSAFSMAGLRERVWGKKKHFSEGQAEQVLDDLFFDFLDVAERLKPKIIVAENVSDMLKGNARGYLRLIKARLSVLGYEPQLFLCNAADFGVPQRRERVFFVAIRSEYGAPRLKLEPTGPLVTAGMALRDLKLFNDEEKSFVREGSRTYNAWKQSMPGDSLSKAIAKNEGDGSFYTHVRLDPSSPACTLSATHHQYYHWSECRRLLVDEYAVLSSFPADYKVRTPSMGRYLMGMSVPPKMMEGVASAIREQWLPYLPEE